MNYIENTLPQEVLAKIRSHSSGTEDMDQRVIKCHYCQHNSIYVYENVKGHVQIKCSKCKKEAIYNTVMCRNGTVRFQLI